MRKLGVAHDTFTFPIMNRAVLLLQNSFQFGELIHCSAIRMGFNSDVYFCNTMIDVYVKGGVFGYACQVFDEMPVRDLVSWTSMISGYVCERNVLGAPFACQRKIIFFVVFLFSVHVMHLFFSCHPLMDASYHSSKRKEKKEKDASYPCRL